KVGLQRSHMRGNRRVTIDTYDAGTRFQQRARIAAGAESTIHDPATCTWREGGHDLGQQNRDVRPITCFGIGQGRLAPSRYYSTTGNAGYINSSGIWHVDA